MTTDLVVAICTWNNADSLHDTLNSIAAQEGDAVTVLVVDNGSSDHTSSVIARHMDGPINLRSVVEAKQGLTSARRRAVEELRDTAWIAFVDDDCRLAPDWIRRARMLCAEVAPDVTGVGGIVELEFEREPPVWIHSIRGAYAEQHPLEHDGAVATLVGAGMIVRCDALIESGWLGAPLIEDRTGTSLLSGGDVEIAMRLAQQGRLWFSRTLVLRHHIPAPRTEFDYAIRLQFSLGSGAALIDQIASDQRPARWAGGAVAAGVKQQAGILRWRISGRFRGHESTLPRLQWAFWSGWTKTVIRQMRSRATRSRTGSGRYSPSGRSAFAHHAEHFK